MSPQRVVVGVDGTSLFRAVDGIGRYSANVLQALALERPDWDFVVIGFREDPARPSLVPGLPNISTHFLPFPRLPYLAAFAYVTPVSVARFLPRLDALLCLNFTLFPHVPALPAVAIVYDLTYVDHPEVMTRRNQAYLAKHVPRAVRHANVVGAISEFTADRIAHEYPDHRPIEVVHCGLDDRFVAPLPPRPSTAPDLPDGYVLAVGTLEPRKNLVTLIRAYAELDPDLRAAHPLVIVGRKGWGPDDVPDDIPRDVVDAVRYTGYVEDADLPRVYAEASLFVFPSLYEGYGLPLLEAMSQGVPAVASDIPTFREIGRGTVDYVAPLDHHAFASVIAARLREPDPVRTAAAQVSARATRWDRSGRELSRMLTSAMREGSNP